MRRRGLTSSSVARRMQASRGRLAGRGGISWSVAVVLVGPAAVGVDEAGGGGGGGGGREIWEGGGAYVVAGGGGGGGFDWKNDVMERWAGLPAGRDMAKSCAGDVNKGKEK